MVAPHGLQNQDTPANEISTTTIPGTSSKQQAAASRKNHNNPKRRRGPDNEYTKPNTPNTTLGDIATLKDTSTSWPDITSPAKRTKQYTGEYTEPNTTKTPVGDSPVGSSENAESNTANEENKQRQSSPVTPPRLPHGFQNQAASPQVQAAAANEVEPSPEPGTSSRQQAKAFTESQGNPKRKRGSDDEYTDPTNHTLDTIIARPAKYIAQTTHGFETRTEKPHDFDSMTDTPLSDSGNTASHTANAKAHQRQTSPTTPPRQAIHNDIVRRTSTTYGILVGTDTIALTPVQGNPTTSPTKKRDRHKNRQHSGRYEGRGPSKQ